jgi:tetratricopeptide (TPR) repeat protein
MTRSKTAIVVSLLLLNGISAALAATGLNKWVVKGFDSLQNDKPQKALKYFQKAMSEHPESARYECYLGLGYFKSGLYDKALNHYARAAQRDPSIIDSAFLFYKASCYRALGLVALERSAWKGVIRWDPNSKFADTAMQGLNDSVMREPASIDTLLATGRKLWDTIPHVATAYYREAYMQPGQARTSEAAMQLVHALNRTGRHEEVLALRSAIPETDELAELWDFQRVLAMIGMNDWSTALAELGSKTFSEDVAKLSDYLQVLCQIKLGHRQDVAAAIPKLEKSVNPDMVAVLKQFALIPAPVEFSK